MLARRDGGLARQRYLDFGPGEHFQQLHGQHTADVALCTKRERWQECVYQHDDAGEFLLGLVANGGHNVYQSQNGFAGRRVVDRVSALTSCYVDLDTYKQGSNPASVDDVLDQVHRHCPWLPLPTFVVYSGRGWYLQWIFREPLNRGLLPRWQLVQKTLVDQLAELGADRACTDAARVLRIVGSKNTKSGRLVEGCMQTGERLSFAAFERAVKRGLDLPQPAPRASPERRPSTASPAQRKQYLRGLELHQARMADCHTLAELRGSPRMADCRHRLLLVYAISLAWYCQDPREAEREAQAFCAAHFLNGGTYLRQRVHSVFRRMAEAQAGVAHLWQGQKVDWRYRLRNSSILSLLEVTPDEQRQLRTLISSGEKERRRVAKRREAGVEPRGDYLRRAEERRSEAARMRREGLTQRAIADRLGVSQAWVSKLLSDHRARSKI